MFIDNWNIPEAEEKRILESGIKITIFFSPGSRLEITEAINSGYLVIADASQLDDGRLNNKEFIACLLHEIGHVLNQSNAPEFVMENEEFLADDYARICGYEKELSEALNKLIIQMPKSFNDNLTKERIERIKSGVKPKNAFYHRHS